MEELMMDNIIKVVDELTEALATQRAQVADLLETLQKYQETLADYQHRMEWETYMHWCRDNETSPDLSSFGVWKDERR